MKRYHAVNYIGVCGTDSADFFNVRHNGEDIASGVTRNAAAKIAQGLRGTVYIYLSDKPLESRKAPWRPVPIPRMPKITKSKFKEQSDHVCN